jgi:protein O-GlcNAc transferase
MTTPATTNHAALGLQHHNAGRMREAVEAYRRYLATDPQNADVLYNLGLALQNLSQFDEAIACYTQAITLRPAFPSPYFNRGNIFAALGRQEEAIASYRRSLELEPDHDRARLHLAHVLGEQGSIDEATEICRQLLDRGQQPRETHEMLLFLEQFRYGQTIASLERMHAEWDRRYAQPHAGNLPPPANDRSPDRPLRLAVVSADLRHHAVAYCVTPILESLNRRDFVLFAYSNRLKDDDWQSRLRQRVDQWHDASKWNDDQLAQQIRADAIDIVLDLSGHTAGNRLIALAQRPAPVQISWIGYPFPSCVAGIDYHMVDRWLAPDDIAPKYRSNLIRLPTGSTCYEVPGAPPEVGPLPARERGYVTFASFNKANKLNAAVIGLWAEVLSAVPNSKLLLKFRGLGDPGTTQRFRRQFALYGVDPQRIEFEGHSEFPQMYARYNTVDLGLDPFPYTGGTTTMLASYMGVPIVTWPGETIASRQSFAVLSALGITDTVAATREDYVRIAVELAGNLDRLADLRQRLRPAFLQSNFRNGPALAVELEKALRQVWHKWCRQV